jgi:hypothetical protein
MKRFRLVFFILSLAHFSSSLLAQTSEYAVNTHVLNLRSGPDTQSEILLTLSEGDIVTVLQRLNSGWWRVDYRGTRGYVYARYLIRAEDYSAWGETYLSSGDDPGCFNFSPRYEYDLDNYLKVKVGSNTDAVIKVMDYYSDVCIRYVYIRSGDVYYIRNIPQGVYYLKIAYGKDWRHKVTDEGQCYGKFMRNAIYKKGKETLNFRIRETYDGYQIPLFELSLDVIRTYAADTFLSDSISEAEFNK